MAFILYNTNGKINILSFGKVIMIYTRMKPYNTFILFEFLSDLENAVLFI